MEFSRKEYKSGVPFPPLGDLPDLGSNPSLLCLLHWEAGSLPTVPPGKPLYLVYMLPIKCLLGKSFCVAGEGRDVRGRTAMQSSMETAKINTEAQRIKANSS